MLTIFYFLQLQGLDVEAEMCELVAVVDVLHWLPETEGAYFYGKLRGLAL